MRDDPRRNLKRVEQALLYEEVFYDFDDQAEEPIQEEEEDLLEMVDQLIEDMESEDAESEDYDEEEEEPPIRNFANNYGRQTKGQQAVRRQAPQKLDKNAAVLVKTRRQLRKEARLQKKREKKAGINRNLKGLTLLAILEILGILAIIGWWLQ